MSLRHPHTHTQWQDTRTGRDWAAPPGPAGTRGRCIVQCGIDELAFYRVATGAVQPLLARSSPAPCWRFTWSPAMILRPTKRATSCPDWQRRVNEETGRRAFREPFARRHVLFERSDRCSGEGPAAGPRSRAKQKRKNCVPPCESRIVSTLEIGASFKIWLVASSCRLFRAREKY